MMDFSKHKSELLSSGNNFKECAKIKEEIIRQFEKNNFMYFSGVDNS